MSGFTDLFGAPIRLTGEFLNPVKTFKDVTASRDGMPWLQGTARNIGAMAFGDKAANFVDQRFLGDPAPGQTGPLTGSIAAVQPQAALDQSKTANIQQMLQQLMQARSQGGM
jgi:hypothetical protein